MSCGAGVLSHLLYRLKDMSELDFFREQIAYLKLWLGIMVVTDISLIGWFVGNYGTASVSLLGVDLLAIAGTSTGIVILHRLIERRIERLRDLQ